MATANTTSNNTHEDDALEGKLRVGIGTLSLISLFRRGLIFNLLMAIFLNCRQ